jgi:DNA polymerase
VIGHNALHFDRFVWSRCIGEPEPAWADTRPLAQSVGLPGGLDAIGRLLGVGGKDDDGSRLMRRLSSAAIDPADPSRVCYPAAGPGDLEVLCRYCIRDVQVTAAVWQLLADVVVEGDVLAAHCAVNDRGVAVDLRLADLTHALSVAMQTRAESRIRELTREDRSPISNPRSVPQVQAWLQSQGVSIVDRYGRPTLRREAVERALADPESLFDPDSEAAAVADSDSIARVAEVLRLRAVAVRAAGAKAARAIVRASRDDRLRDLFTYHQAHTGRWSSSGVQVHNIPRPDERVPVPAVVRWLSAQPEGADPGRLLDRLERAAARWGVPVGDVLSALARPVLTAAPGRVLLIADYASIECRVLAWLAGQQDQVQLLATGGDPYRAFAAKLFTVEPAAVSKPQRQIGKVCVLGLGYGMGAASLRVWCALRGIDLATAGVTAEQCVSAYRRAHAMIAALWQSLNDAAIAAVGGSVRRVGRCWFSKSPRGDLLLTLPSGRAIHYPAARIEEVVPAYTARLGLESKPRPTVVYTSARGPRQLYGGLLAENAAQATARDVLAAAIVRLERIGYPVVLHVHDEVVAEVEAQRVVELEQFAETVAHPPDWAAGLPIAVEAFASPRYYKSPLPGWPTALTSRMK